MYEPLVDAEGYPRSDIDVYQVRHARAGIYRLQNDHKALMREIEALLFSLHAKTPLKAQEAAIQSPPQQPAETTDEEPNGKQEETKNAAPSAFALVNAVAPDSPAYEAVKSRRSSKHLPKHEAEHTIQGIKRGDLIAQLGDVHSVNDVPAFLQANENVNCDT
jgi:hypothetical protein